MKLSHILVIFAVIHGSSLANHGEAQMTTLQTPSAPRKYLPENEQKTVSTFLVSNPQNKKNMK